MKRFEGLGHEDPGKGSPTLVIVALLSILVLVLVVFALALVPVSGISFFPHSFHGKLVKSFQGRGDCGGDTNFFRIEDATQQDWDFVACDTTIAQHLSEHVGKTLTLTLSGWNVMGIHANIIDFVIDTKQSG